jgi:hypothetical protein
MRVVVQFDGLITFTGRFLEGGEIEQFYITTPVADHPGLLHSARNHGDARAPNSQHLREVKNRNTHCE